MGTPRTLPNPYDDLFGVLTTHPDSPLSGDLMRPIGAPPALGSPDATSNAPGGNGLYSVPEEQTAQPAQTGVGHSHPFFSDAENNIHNGFLRKLAKTGDVIGSIFAPGMTAMVPGTRLNQEFEEKRQAGLEGEQAATEHQKAQTEREKAQTQMMGESVPVQTADGRTIFIPKADFAKYEMGQNANKSKENVAETAAGSRTDVANINAKSREDVEKMKEEVAKGNVSRVLFDPATQETVFYNKQGEETKRVKGQYNASSWLPKTSSTTQYMQDADGNVVALPKTTTSGPVLPGGAQTQVPAVPTAGGGAPQVHHNTTDANPPRGTTAAHTVLGPDGQPLQGKGAHAEGEKRANIDDVSESFKDYQKDFSAIAPKLNDDQRRAMQVITDSIESEHDWAEKLPVVGNIEGMFNKMQRGQIIRNAYNVLGKDGQQLVNDYFNTLARHFAFMKTTQGTAGRNPAMINAELHTVPLPFIDPGSAADAIQKYQKVIDRHAQVYHRGGATPASSPGKPGDPLNLF